MKSEGYTFTLRSWNLTHKCNDDIKGKNRCAYPAFVADWYMDGLKALGNKAKIHDIKFLAVEFNKTM